MSEKQTLGFQAEVSQLLQLMIHSLYSNKEIFLRELVSNAVDAVQKIKRLSSMGQYNGALGDALVEVAFDADKKTITISDNGLGMTAEEIKKYIITRGFGDATVIPLSETPSIQKKLSWLTTTLMGGLDRPEIPGEESDEDEGDDVDEEVQETGRKVRGARVKGASGKAIMQHVAGLLNHLSRRS